MKRSQFTSAAILLALAVPAIAAQPNKQPVGRYTILWTNSAFTNPVVEVIKPTPPPNPVENYTLASLCKIKDGWHVVLLNKKDRRERVRLAPNSANTKGFLVSTVENAESRKAARVEINAGGQSGWVTFDPRFLTVRKAGAKSAKPKFAPKPNLPRPRVRRVPIPLPTATAAKKKEEEEEERRKKLGK